MQNKTNAKITSLLFFLVSSSWAILIKSNLLSENYFNTISILYIYIYLFIIFQTILIYFVFKTKKISKNNKILFISLLFFFNFYTLALSVSSEFTVQQKTGKLKYIFISLIISFVLTYLLITKEKILKILCIFYLASNLFSYFNLQDKMFLILNKNSNNINKFAEVNFKIKKNIYIYSFESLMPESLVKKHFNIQNVEYANILREENLFIPKNNFADNIPTTASINSTLYIDPVKWRNLEENKSLSFFAGREISPLFKILKKNGYKINTGYSDSSFGPPGKFVDNYFTYRSINNNKENFLKFYPNFCQYKMPWYHFQVFGYCEIIAISFNIKAEDRGFSLQSFNNFAIDLIKSTENPTFSWFHIYSQTHPGANRKGFVDEFQKLLPETAEFIKKIINNIKSRDPDSILIIFGDHNTMVETFSIEENLKKSIKQKYENFDQYTIIDTYPTQSAVLDYSNLCPNSISNLSNSNYTTNTMIVNEILKCFIGKNKIFDYKIDYSLPNNKDFKNYLYE